MNLLIEASIRALFLGLGVAAVLRLARVRSSAARHAAWTAVLAAMLLMPLALTFTPPIVLRSVTVPSISSIQLIPDPVPEPPPLLPARPAVTDMSKPISGIGVANAAATPAPRPTARPWTSSLNWWRVAEAIYFCGVLFLFMRLVVGWRAMRRVMRSTYPAALIADEPIYESSAIATPLTVGIFKPRIVLPSSWPTWTDDMRNAVLAHERAHVRRRDALTSLLAHLNRCIFWFHPLAWWLERTLAANAEEACDVAGLGAVSEPRKYAEILISLAGTIRERGGRVAWQGLGVSGNGSLNDRIDRVLRGDVQSRLSWPHRVVLATGSAIVVVLGIACQAQTELRPDPAVTARMSAEEARIAPFRAVSTSLDTMTPQKAAAIEAALVTNPDDLGARETLMDYYTSTYIRTDPKRMMELKRPHVLWVIEHAPDTDVYGNLIMFSKFHPRDKNGDLIGYEAGKKLWLANLAKPDVSARMLRRAAAYFETWDVPLAEEALLRGQAAGLVDPKEPAHAWYADLARFYINALEADAGMLAPTPNKPPFDEHAYANAVRQKLAESKDPLLLTTVATFLMPRGVEHDSRTPALKAVADASLERALVLDPQNAEAKALKARIPAMERDASLRRFLYYGPPNARSLDADLAALSDADKFYVLPRLARNVELKGDLASFAKARKYADDALGMAPRFINTPDYAPAVYTAQMTLGLLDVRAYDLDGAARHLRAASEVPASIDIKVSELSNSLLLVALLKNHKEDAVVSFLERMTKVSTSAEGQKWLHDSAAKIRQGLMPEWYQRMVQR